MNILLNGVGRIGKSIVRIINNDDTLNIVAINELNTNIKNIAYSINYDSTYGNLKNRFIVDNNYIKNSKQKILILNKSSLKDIDYKKLNIDIIIDASGAKVDIALLNSLKVRNIFLTHPNSDANINLILGVNDDIYDKTKHKIVSTSSCNATALLPLLKFIDDRYKIEMGDITTIHPLLNHQKVLDSSCLSSQNREVDCNFEFGRGALQNIIPSATTTIKACSYVLKNINSDILSSSSLRVPTSTVGAISISLYVKNSCEKKELIKLFEEYSKKQKYDILLNNYDPLVSSDFIKSTYTTIIDNRFTDVKQNKLIKLVLWYDNEYGYASKVVDIAKLC